MRGAQNYLVELEQLVSEEAEPNKERLLGTVTDLFFLTKHQHTDDDIAIFGNVMVQLAYQIETEPRAAFAERIADSDRAWRGLMLRLANDEIQVAWPVLERSECITEEDLVEIARGCGLEHLRAMSGRAFVTDPVADVIVTRGDDEVLVCLAGSAGVQLSRRGYAELLKRATACRDLQKIVESRGAVGRDIVSRIWLYGMDWIGKIPHKKTVEHTHTQGLVVTPTPESDAPPTDVEQARSDSGVDLKQSASMLLMHARAKNVAEAISSLSALSGTEQSKVQYLLSQAPVNAFGIFCRAHKIDSNTFAALLQLRVAAGDLDTGDLIDALRRYDSMNPWRARQLMQAREQVQDSA